MAVTFTTAPTVYPGDPVTSDNYVSLAAAFNDRLRSGLGDPTYRIFYYLHGLFKNPRNGEDDLTPSQAEYWEFFQHLNPDDGAWPSGAPGEPEGANVGGVSFLGNALMMFAFGSAALGIDSEDAKLAGIPVPASGNAESFWENAKLQRGAYDPATGALASPTFTAARDHYAIRYSLDSTYGNAYGGYFPSPRAVYDETTDPPTPIECPESEGPTINPIYQFTYIFSAIVDGLEDFQFSSCSYGIYYTPFAYYIITTGGTISRVLSKKEYIEGPYDSFGRVARSSGDQLNRIAVNAFLKEFRGSDGQRAEAGYHLQQAFDFERFFATQYQLAPNKGTQDGETSVEENYPIATFSASGVADDLATWNGGGTSKTWTSGFVLGGIFVKATGLQEPVTLEILDGSEVLETVSLSPDESDEATRLFIYDDSRRPTLSVKLTSTLTLVAGSLTVECSELLDYKPEIHDAYLLLRLAGATGPIDGNGTEGSGQQFTGSKTIGDAYFTNGLIMGPMAGVVGEYGTSQVEVNHNPVYEAARQMSRHVRVMRRHDIVGYEVINDGGTEKSVCYFKRYAFGLDNDTPLDQFEGIAPSRFAVTEIKSGYVYEVTDGSISYNGETKTTGQTFTGAEGVTTFADLADEENEFPPAVVYEHDGIRADAPPRDYTNEWLMGVQFKGYVNSESSFFKPEAYADIYPLSERCIFGSTEIKATQNADLFKHFSYEVSDNPLPEAPTGWRYANGINNAGTAGNLDTFYKSCRIYEPDVEIESCKVFLRGDGDTDELVRVVFKSRFHHHENAPSTIPFNMATWDLDALAEEQDYATAGTPGYRTVENGIRAYLASIYLGTPCPSYNRGGKLVLGDFAFKGGIDYQDTHHLFGACYPHFFFTHLIPSPYVDTNNTQDETDTRITCDNYQLMETYLRAMCEGFVDAVTTSQVNCTEMTIDEFYKSRVPGCIFDYTFANLCYEAFGGRGIQILPFEGVEIDDAGNIVDAGSTPDIRPDNLVGYGPIPNTWMRSAIFNQLSGCVNLLTKVRLMLPAELELNRKRYEDATSVTLLGASVKISGADCPPTGQVGSWNATTEVVDYGWSAAGALPHSFNASSSQESNQTTNEDVVYSEREEVFFRFQFTTSNAMDAIPDHWRDQVETYEGVGFFGLQTTTTTVPTFTFVADAGDAFDCGGGPAACGGGGGIAIGALTEETYTCKMFDDGSIDPGEPPIGYVYYTGTVNGSAQPCGGGTTKTIEITAMLCQSAFFKVELV